VFHPRRILPLIVLMPVLLGACITWQPVAVPPGQYVTDEAPERVRVTTVDGTRMTIEGPVVRAGAVVGTRSAGAALLDDIRTLEVEGTSVLRTVLLVAPAVVLVAVVALASCRC
jgi:hypothetical protein